MIFDLLGDKYLVMLFVVICFYLFFGSDDVIFVDVVVVEFFDVFVCLFVDVFDYLDLIVFVLIFLDEIRVYVDVVEFFF